MKKLAVVLLVAVTMCFAGATSWAASITPDVVTSFYLNGSTTATASPYLRTGSSVTYSHNILDNGFSIGDTLTSVSITFSIDDMDDGNDVCRQYIPGITWDLTEYVTMLTDGIATTFEMSNGSITYVAGDALLQLQTDGSLYVTLTPLPSIFTNTSWISDFTLYSSILNAEYIDNTPDTPTNPPVTSAPEPATLLLLGLGLLGLTGAGRKFKK